MESIKRSLVEKEEEIQALEEANSTLRQQNFKFLETENQLRRECNDLKSQINSPNRFKNKRRTFNALPEKEGGSTNFLRESMASEITKKNSIYKGLNRGSQVSDE